jgi:gamma-glutamylcyclotransferase (GGCT)/AIG2-like uncharacterized protein YtfP
MMEKLDGRAASHSPAEVARAKVLAAPASHRLFVYGTLMQRAASDYGRAARNRLQHEAWPDRLVATTPGQLFELGQYPGLVASSALDELVHGELLLLSDPTATLAWLDEYEAISSDPQADNEYVRKLKGVRMTGGPRIDAWTYLYIKPTTGLKRNASGRWTS